MTGRDPRSTLTKPRRKPFAADANIRLPRFGLTCLVFMCAVVPAASQPALSPDPGAAGAVQTAAPADEGAGAGAIPVMGRDTVVVTGRRDAPARRDVIEQARELSRIGRFRLRDEALPRFETPLCPGVAGLKPDLAEIMADRIRANVARLDVALAEGECSPNLVVAFVDDGRTFLAGFEQDQPGRFSLIAAPERDELLSEEGPVRVWSNIEPLYANGAPLPRYRGRVEMPDARGQINRMFLPTRTDIHAALVLFDREAVVGMTLVQLADYATMRGLTHTRPASGDESMATILALFEDGGRDVAELTGFDVSYLCSLYYWRPDLSARTKLAGVGRRAADGAGDAREICPPAPDETPQEDAAGSQPAAFGASHGY